MVEERWPGAAPHEGAVPEGWVMEDMFQNKWNRFRLWRAPDGRLRYTMQPVRKERGPRYDIREEDGMLFARRRWKRNLYEAR